MIKVLNSVLWSVAVISIIYCGILYTYKLHFIQFRFKDMLKNLLNKRHNASSLGALMISLGGKIGVGSIAGISLAISLGGEGTVFWIWIIGVLCAPIVFAETILGIKYHGGSANVYGGPSCYMRQGLGLSKLGNIYAILILLSYIWGFSSIQSNTIAISVADFMSIKPIFVGIVTAIVTLTIISGGVKNILKISNILVPMMLFVYILSSFCILAKHPEMLRFLMPRIVSSAFNCKVLSISVLSTFIIGMQRGIFASEAGMGTGAIAAAIIENDDPVECGFVQMIGIYVTIFSVCTLTAMVIMISGNKFAVTNGIENVQRVFFENLGNTGIFIIVVSIVLFAFSTILSGYYNGESSLRYLFPKISNRGLVFLKLITFGIVIFGAVCKATLLWNIVNIFTASLSIINCYALCKLNGEVIHALERYDKYGKMK